MDRQPLLVTMIVTACLALTAVPAHAQVLHVDDDAALGGDGLAWNTAYRYLQDALTAAGGGGFAEIRVAGGTHTPDLDEGGNVTPLDRSASFQLLDGVAVRGGFRGLAGGGAPDDRDLVLFESILSGDVDGNDTGAADDPTHAMNSFHVVSGMGVDATAILDGFTVSGGYADGMFPDNDGGGLCSTGGSGTYTACRFAGNFADDDGGGASIENGTPVFTMCAFEDNIADSDGGGAYVDNLNPTFIQCTFDRNRAGREGGGAAVNGDDTVITDCTFTGNSCVAFGGGLFCDATVIVTGTSFVMNESEFVGGGVANEDSPVFTNCRFELNTAADCGGGWYMAGENPVLDGCMFIRNTAGRDGGAWFQECENTIISNTLFLENEALGGDGGAMAICCGEVRLANCRFLGNEAVRGGAIFNEDSTRAMNCVFGGNSANFGGAWFADSEATITNCSFCGNFAGDLGGALFTDGDVEVDNSILWGSTAVMGGDEIWYEFEPVEVRNSDVEGSGGSGPGWDPAVGIDLGGNIDEDPQFVGCLPIDPADTDLHIMLTSPAIDAGLNAVIQDDFADLDGDADVNEPTPLDLDLTTRVVNGTVDMGAYETPIEEPDEERAHPGWNWVDNGITLTMDEPTWWSSLTGQPKGVVPFPVLDPGVPPGRPAMDGTNDRVLRGYVLAWAVDSEGRQIRWNHLKGEGTVLNYDGDYAWEYNAYTYAVNQNAAGHGAPVGTAGELKMDGLEYAANYGELVFNFQAAGAAAWGTPPGALPGNTVVTDTDLTLHPMGGDFRQTNDGPITTKASILIWNENEFQFSGTHRCITCWDQTLISRYAAPPNSFLRMFLQTDHGKARIDGHAAPQQCDVLDDPDTPEDESVTSIAAPLLGVHARLLAIDAAAPDWSAAAGGNLHGLGEDDTARILYDVVGAPGEATNPNEGVRAALGRAIDKAFAGMHPGDAVTDAPGKTGPAEAGAPTLPRVSATEKGSLLVFPNVELRWDANGNLKQDTIISLTNDYPQDVRIQLYFINGDRPIAGP